MSGVARTPLGALNAMETTEFVALLAGIFEHSPWVPEAAAARRPFASVAALHECMVGIVAASPTERQLALLRAHPELARRGPLTSESASEQGGMGLDRLAADEAARFDALNAAYQARFGFPFIIAVRGQRDRTAIRAALEARIAHDAAAEHQAALAEVGKIAGFRLHDLIADAAGYLTVHVLDTARGTPGANLPLELFRIDAQERLGLGQWRTNSDGRLDDRLLAGGAMNVGIYEVVFDVAGWRAESGDADCGFYDLIAIRFRVTDSEAHYHIPLLLSPYGYSTYRGS